MSDELPYLLMPLARLIDEQRPPVLLVAGTGISIGATRDPRATWKGLLLDGINRTSDLGLATPEVAIADRKLVARAFANFDLRAILELAESIISRLGGPSDPRFADWLKDSVGSLKAKPDLRDSLDAIADLVRAGALVLTTNYDSLLSEVTGLDPVTWEEPNKILEVITRRRRGIVHIHGHWTRPSSVILGQGSYDRIKGAALPQTELKSLWLQWHWVYVGCGSGGLDDPNLGALLQWAHDSKLGQSALPDYFLSTAAVINGLPAQIGKSANLVRFPYANHAVHLPKLLRLLVPENRPFPFERIGPNARRVRRADESPLSSPFPSWDEYVARSVPPLAADQDVLHRLDTHGWVFILDVASSGKTTLTYRIASRHEYLDQPTFYLSLSRLPVSEGDSDISPQAALARLARPGALFVIDDAHHQPELASILWQQWHERPMGSKLIIVATRMEKALNLPGDSSLHDLEVHPDNPAVPVRAGTRDLARIANYVLQRLGHKAAVLKPSKEALYAWHDLFARELGAFVVAVSQRQHELLHGQFELPESSAAIWMKERHLKNLAYRDLRNATCLAVFGNQEFELDVPVGCLPHPARIDRLLKSGLAERVVVSREPFIRYSLREGSWAKLILGTIEFSRNQLGVVVKAAAANLSFALAIVGRLRRSKREEELASFWKRLTRSFVRDPRRLTERACEISLTHLHMFLNAAEQQRQLDLVQEFWRGLAARPDALTERILAAPLNDLTWFMKTVMEHRPHGLAREMWRALTPYLERLAEKAAEAPLGHITSFLETAAQQGQGRIVDELGRALAARSEQIADRAFETSLLRLNIFVSVIIRLRQAYLVEQLWLALSSQLERLAEHAFEAQLDSLTTFLKIAMEQDQKALALQLWRALAAQPTRLVDRASEAPFKDLSGFLEASKRHGQDYLIQGLLDAVGTRPEPLIDRAFESPFSDLSAFLNTIFHLGAPLLCEKLWSALHDNVAVLADRAFEAPLMDLSAFLNTAARHSQHQFCRRLWQLLSVYPQRMAERALAVPLSELSAFLKTAARQGERGFLEQLWQTLSAQREALCERIFEAPLSDISAFLETAREETQQLLVQDLWNAFARQPDTFKKRLIEAPFHGLSTFLATAKKHSQDAVLEEAWHALATELGALVERALTAPLDSFGAFLVTAIRQEQQVLLDRIWEMLANEVDRFAKHASTQRPSQLSRFVVVAPDTLKRQLIQRFDVNDWCYSQYRNQRFSTGAAGLAVQFGRWDRDDLKTALMDNILFRKKPSDFADKRTALLELSRLISVVRTEQQSMLIELLKTVCTEAWLEGAYRFGGTTALAGALHTIAIHQPPSVVRTFWHRELGVRLVSQWSNSQFLDDDALSGAIQLLGVSQLIGWGIDPAILSHAPFDRIGTLAGFVKHRSGAAIVEPWQRQLWLGLRVLASTGQGLLRVDRDALIGTLDLWRANVNKNEIKRDKEKTDNTEQRINASMVTWLQDCVRTLTGRLVANQERLWVLAGFPRDLRLAGS